MAANHKSNSAGTFPVIFLMIILFSAKNISAQQIINARSIDKMVTAIDRQNSWTKTDTIPLELSLEGGFAVFYHKEGQLQKIAATYYGDTYREEKIHSLSGRNLLLVLEKTYHYNYPITYDSADLKAVHSNEEPDLKRSTVLKQKNYFSNGHLFRKIDETGAVITNHLKADENKLIHDFNNISRINNSL